MNNNKKHFEKKLEKYLKGRIEKGIAQGSKNEYFTLDRVTEKVATLYMQEQMDKAIKSVRRKANISGIKGLCSKDDVIALLKKIKNEKFEIPREVYPITK